MGLDTNERQGVVYFTGYEVEHTICHGMHTLFVVGTPNFEEIKQQADKQDIKHIYFGTSQSFNPANPTEYRSWDNLIARFLAEGYWVTLDFGVEHTDLVTGSHWNECDRFVPMISVKLPHIKLYNYNATLKLDDTTWGHSNPGVWTHQLHDLMAQDKYTYWDQYTQDEEVK